MQAVKKTIVDNSTQVKLPWVKTCLLIEALSLNILLLFSKPFKCEWYIIGRVSFAVEL